MSAHTRGLIDVKLLSSGIVQRLPIENSALFREIYVWRCYERERLVKPGDIVVDAGAMTGIFTLKAAAQKASKILAFEPFFPSYLLLRKNIKWNKLKNVIAFNIALSNRNEERKLWVHEAPGSQTFRKETEEFVMVPTMKLDDVLEEEGVDHVDFIKIDVEGWEIPVLMGANEILKQAPIHLGIAGYHYPEQLAELSELLISREFNVKTLWERYLYAWKD